jgi:hypothetical protein
VNVNVPVTAANAGSGTTGPCGAGA